MTETILDEAKRIVQGSRNEDYGAPSRDFARTGIGWQMVLRDWARETLGEKPIPPELVALCMVQVKVSREVHRPKRDNRVDGAGYFMALDMVVEDRERRADQADERILPMPQWCALCTIEKTNDNRDEACLRGTPGHTWVKAEPRRRA